MKETHDAFQKSTQISEGQTYEPFFIVGCDRSGLTLLQVLLDSHPDLALPPESQLFRRYYQLFEHYGSMQFSKNKKLLLHDLLHDPLVQKWKMGLDESHFELQCSGAINVGEVLSELFEIYAAKNRKKYWAEKAPQHLNLLKDIIQIFPQARFLHIVRDGRDVAVSAMKYPHTQKPLNDLAREWCESLAQFEAFLKRVSKDRCLTVRYEDLVTCPDETLDQICKFVHLKPYPYNQKIYVPNTDLRKYYIQTNGEMHALLQGPISKKRIGVYQKDLSWRQIEIFEFYAQTFLQRYGYETQCREPRGPWIHERMVFDLQKLCLKLRNSACAIPHLFKNLKSLLFIAVRKFRRPQTQEVSK